ncbi:MAG: 3-deoxy-manno-octulosonate cytidylyltransferase [Candidatus Eisenbacteria bacterium]
MILGVIPARYGSTRFPGKALVSLHGRPLIEHVVRRALRIDGLDELLVATDDPRIAEAVRAFGGAVEMTRGDHPSGTDRIGEVVARRLQPPDFILNLQGDEPLLPIAAVEEMLRAMAGEREREAIWTLAAPITKEEEYLRPSVVKAVRGEDGRALYFSRAPVPHDALARDAVAAPLRHIGIYGFTRAAFARFLALPPSPLERLEKLEQLRALEAGIPIHLVLSTEGSPGIDTPGDLDRLLEAYPTLEALEAASG